MKTLTLLLTATLLVVGSPAALADEAPLDTSAVDEGLDLYWSQNREIRAIQKRIYSKAGRFGFDLMVGVIPSDEFYTYFPVGARVDFYAAEDVFIELSAAYLPSMNRDLTTFLESQMAGTLLVDIPQTLVAYEGLSVGWSPLHGKFAFLTTEVGHFDFHAAIGAALLQTNVHRLSEEKLKLDVAGTLSLGVRVYFLEWLGLRLDYKQFFYAAERGGVAHPAEISLGLTFFTPSLY